VFYPEAAEDRCTAALSSSKLLVNPARRRRLNRAIRSAVPITPLAPARIRHLADVPRVCAGQSRYQRGHASQPTERSEDA
jgi:hypothetical protein